MSREEVKKTPGAILKQARKSLGLTLGDAAAMTRIPGAMLSHLESDRYDEYTADVFVRGHLRSYARELQLDPEVVIQAYDRHTGRQRRSSKDKGKDGKAARESISKARDQVSGVGSRVSKLTRHVRASHVVAVGLVLVFLFFVVNLVTGSRATAKDPDQFQSTSEEDWELEEAAQETRWALEQPGESHHEEEDDKDD